MACSLVLPRRRMLAAPRVCRMLHFAENFTGDFSMLHWIHGMTGSGDTWRCLHRSGCVRLYYLRPSRHMENNEDRSVDVICDQWHLTVWTVATWTVSHKGSPVAFTEGAAHVSCPTCKKPLPLSDEGIRTGVLGCRGPACDVNQPVYVLHHIAKSPLAQAFNAARTVCGGVRGFPLLRGMRCRLQFPVLHCTGTISKMVINYVLACLPHAVQEVARPTMLAISGKGAMDALYLREYRELVAHAAARPDIFSSDLDRVFVMLLQLVQLLNASWRASLTDEVAANRVGASSICRLAASLLGPLLEEVKFLDPVTKDAKVHTLYMHAPIAHLRHQVGANRSAVAFISDDLIEGHLRAIGRYISNHGNNASQAALLSDLAALCDATIKFSTPRSHPSSLVFTKKVRVCECWKTLGAEGPADFQALQDIGLEDAQLSVGIENDGKELLLTLPLHDQVDANKAKRLDASGRPLSGKKEALRRGLRRSMGVIHLCFCGSVTGMPPSPIMQLVRTRQAAAKAQKAAAATRSGGSCAATGSGSSRSASDDDGGSSANDENTTGAAARDDVPRAVLKAQRVAASTVVRQCIPPMWLLKMVFPDAAAYATVVGVAQGNEDQISPDQIDVVLRQHITTLRCFLLRTRTPQFVLWSATATVDRDETIEAAETMTSRLRALRMANLPLSVRDGDVVMEF